MVLAKQIAGVNRTSHFLPVVLAWAVLLLGAGRSEASLEKLRQKMGEFAADLKKWLDSRPEKNLSVTVVSFQNLPGFAANPGPGVTKILTDELKKAQVSVQVKAKLGIAMRVHRVPEMGPCQLIDKARIDLEIVDSNNNRLHKDDLEVTDRGVLAVLFPCDPPVIEREGVRASKGPYSVEVLVNGKPRPLKDEEGMPFVDLALGDVYSLRLINRSRHEASVWVGIDGLSMFAFNKDPEPDGRWHDYRVIVPPREEAKGKDGIFEVQGWYFHKGEGGSRKFMVTDYPESAASLKGISTEIGVISIQFREAWLKGARGPGKATGFGPAFTQNFQTVEREVGELTALTIRYSKE